MKPRTIRVLASLAASLLLIAAGGLFFSCLVTNVWDGKIVLAWLCALGFIWTVALSDGPELTR